MAMVESWKSVDNGRWISDLCYFDYEMQNPDNTLYGSICRYLYYGDCYFLKADGKPTRATGTQMMGVCGTNTLTGFNALYKPVEGDTVTMELIKYDRKTDTGTTIDSRTVTIPYKTGCYPEGVHEVLEYCPDGITEKGWRDCIGGKWVEGVQEWCEQARPSPCSPYGDIDGDGLITEKDLNLLTEYWAEIITLTPDQLRRADINGDGIVDQRDVMLLADYLRGRSSTFPVCSSSLPPSKIPLLLSLGAIVAGVLIQKV